MGGRRETKLAVAFQRLPLVEQVEAEGAGKALGGLQGLATAQCEAKTGHSLYALVRARDEEVDFTCAKVELHPAEGTHGIDEIYAIAPACRGSNFGNGIHDAGGRLAMHCCHLREGPAGQGAIDGIQIGQFVLRAADRLGGNTVALDDFQNPLTVGAVDDDEPFCPRGRDGRDDRLNGEGAASLHGHGFPAFCLRHAGQAQQTITDILDHLDEFKVTRTEVTQHGLLDRVAGGQRSRGEERFVAFYHGSEKVFTLVMYFMASMTPSLIPRPESFTPPNGEDSMR